MSVHELKVISDFFARAICPEDIFGSLAGASKEVQIKAEYRKLAKALHPDRHAGDNSAGAIAKDLFQQLEEMHTEGLARIADGSYGKRVPLPHKVPVILKGKYVREAFLCAGQIADLHIASIESGRRKTDLILKVARKAADNDLLLAEHAIIKKIRASKKFLASPVSSGIPEIIETFLLDDGKQWRRVNVFKILDGFYDATVVRGEFPIGVDGRTIVWMWKRVLVLLEWTWKLGFVHGAVLPPHLMFFPDNRNSNTADPRKHSIRLVDWCYAVEQKSRTRLSAWLPEYKDFYAPEILAKKPFGPWTDLYMGAKTILYLAGGDPSKNGFPDSVPKEIIISISKCLQETPDKRPQSIGKYFEEFTAAARKAYGAQRWHDFNMPRT